MSTDAQGSATGARSLGRADATSVLDLPSLTPAPRLSRTPKSSQTSAAAATITISSRTPRQQHRRVELRPRELQQRVAAFDAPNASRCARRARRAGSCRSAPSTTKRNRRLSSGTRIDQHEQLTELDADVERQQRREQMRAGELQRLAQREREAEAVNQPEAERDRPAPVQRAPARRPVGAPAAGRAANDVLERHVDDRDGDQRLDQRRKPERVGREVVRRCDQRHRMRDRERRDDDDQRAEPAERDHQAEQEQQVIDAVEDVEEAVLDEAQRRLVPARIELRRRRDRRARRTRVRRRPAAESAARR